GPCGVKWGKEQADISDQLPGEMRTWLNAKSLRPGAAGWVRPRVADVVVEAGHAIRGGRLSGAGITLDLDNGARTFDHVLLATGYRIDVARLGILAPNLLAGITTDDGSPVLGHGYESCVPGLHFVGSAAGRSYGPLLRFVWGAGYAARTVARHVCAHRSPGYAWSQPCPDEVFTRPTETASSVS